MMKDPVNSKRPLSAMTRRPWVAGFSHNPVLSANLSTPNRGHSLSDLPTRSFFSKSASSRISNHVLTVEPQRHFIGSPRSPVAREHAYPSRSRDGFGQAIETYVEVMRLEGQKALTVAKQQIAADMKQDHEKELTKLRQEVSERDQRLALVQVEAENRRETCLRVAKQLRNFAVLLSKRSQNSTVCILRHSKEGMSLKQALELWHRNACNSYEERKRERIPSTLYETKLLMRVHAAWRLDAAIQRTVRQSEERLSEQQRANTDSVKRAENERDEALEKVNKLLVELDAERSRRAEFSKRIKSKFEDFSNEFTVFGSSRGSGLN